MSRKTTPASRRRAAAAKPGQRQRERASRPSRAAPGRAAAHGPHPVSGSGAAAERIAAFLAEWAPTAARILLGLVLAWFGYHELVQPAPWTGYVPAANPGSDVAVLFVLAHGWVLLLLAVALAAGIAPRTAAAVAAVLLTEIVISLMVSGGLSDLVIRDVGVLGLAVCLTGCTRQRAVLSR